MRFLSPRGDEVGPAGVPAEPSASLPTVPAPELLWDGDPVDYDAVIDCLVPRDSQVIGPRMLLGSKHRQG